MHQRVDPHQYCSIRSTSKRDYKCCVVYRNFENGREKRKYFRKRIDAVQWIEFEFCRLLERSLYGHLHRTFREIYSLYVTDSEKGRGGRKPIGAGFVRELQRYLDVHLADDSFMDRVVADTSNLECAAFMRRMRDSESQQKRRAAMYVKAACAHGVSEGYLFENPMREINAPSRVGLSSNQKKVNKEIPSKRTVSALLEAADRRSENQVGQYWLNHERFAAMFYTVVFTGMRIGEIRALHLNNIDFENTTVEVRFAIAHNESTIKRPKSKAGIRNIPLHPVLATRLERWIPHRHPVGDLLFPSRNGTPVTPKVVGRQMRNFLKDNSVEHLGWHGFRHFYASSLISQGVDILRVKKYVGHESVQMTLDVYGHLMREEDGALLDLDS